MKILAHFDAVGDRAFGLWWIDPATQAPRSLYLDPDGPQQARANLIMFNKGNPDVTWSEWFDQLTTRSPYTESWEVYDSMGFTPQQMLSTLNYKGAKVS